MTDLYLTKQLRLIEQVNAQRLAPGTLMQRAGQAAANWLAGRMPARTASFLVLCGPGNNGGDGYVCARALRELGHACVCWAPDAAAASDAREVSAIWSQAGGETSKELPRHGRFDVVVDAMFGIGLSRSLSGPYLEASRWANQSGAQVVSLDVPSGLDSDSGVWVGEVAGVRASATLTFLGDKPGLHMSDGCDGAGTVYVEPLGIEPGPSPGHLNGPEHFAAILRPRDRNSHKGHFGSVAVIGGEIGMIGATLLAGRAALRMGAGRVYVCCVGDPDMRVDPVCPELMFRPLDRLPPVQAVVIGCGLGTSEPSRRALSHALSIDTPLVLDADALNLVALDQRLRQALAQREAASVLTPHPLEAARLLAGTPELHVNSDRISAAAVLAQQLRSAVALKGAGSVIVDRPAGADEYWINPTGGPALATAGTGDVLAGMIGALIAQGFEVRDSVLAATWLHGRAAQLHGADVGLLASEVALLAARELARMKNPG